MKVYVVESGERYEGGSVEGLFQSYKSARKKALALVAESSFTDWKEESTDDWSGGCDWIRITEMEVLP